MLFEIEIYIKSVFNWRPPSLNELTPIIFDTEMTHLGSEASNLTIKSRNN